MSTNMSMQYIWCLSHSNMLANSLFVAIIAKYSEYFLLQMPYCTDFNAAKACDAFSVCTKIWS
ncbi:hypothetical protein PSECIP111854_00501 [Pseudoalteromonas sp. CIP111854]|uniref:Uncharacterized protein n=1 Tax=Pseudoalteromonas holothuriae TaxID=2963714 RepID=A0A9W4QRR0_9GAMM|nr:hypothetical protein PSECIP111854_00501 [Pseudoalteromonas sp. CIP111854]